MSNTLFGRTIEVSVGLRGQPALLIKNLRIVFKIEKNLEKTPNNSTIEIYNLSADSRAIFEQKKAAIRVHAGYGDRAKDIFIGDIATVVTKKTGADIITSVESGDGLLEFQNKEADLSFQAGSKVGTIMDKLTDAFGLIKGEIQGLNTDDEYLNGVVFSGKVHNHIDAIIGKQPELEWSIQDTQLTILPKGKGSARSAVLLTAQSGLIGSPFKRVVLNYDIAKKKDGKDVENGVQFKSLLNPEIVPGRLIQIDADFVSGTFKAMKVTHSGDSHSGTFYSDVEAIAL